MASRRHTRAGSRRATAQHASNTELEGFSTISGLAENHGLPIVHTKTPEGLHFSYVLGEEMTAETAQKAGLPSREEYTKTEAEYLASLSIRKRDKALLTQSLFDDVWDVLHDPKNARLRSPQFRFWVRKMFKLASVPCSSSEEEDVSSVVLHEGLPVALQSQIYDILGYCHLRCHHGGRDRTVAQVRELYSWIPKELVARYVKACPTCAFKKPYSAQRAAVSRASQKTMAFQEDDMEAMAIDGDPVPASLHARRSMPAKLAPSNHFPSRTLPPLPSVSPAIPADPLRWLADMACQPGPSSYPDVFQLPPIMRRTESESDATPRRKPTTRLALPPLMKSLSESVVDPADPMHWQRAPFNVPEQFQIPLRQEGARAPQDWDPTMRFFVHEDSEQCDFMALDPLLVDSNDACALSSSLSTEAEHGSVVTVPVDLPRKVLIPINRTDSHPSASSEYLSIASGSSYSISPSVSGHLSNASTRSVSSAGQKSSRSFDAQDWESSYCLEASRSF